jgi:hypothetical protein
MNISTSLSHRLYETKSASQHATLLKRHVTMEPRSYGTTKSYCYGANASAEVPMLLLRCHDDKSDGAMAMYTMSLDLFISKQNMYSETSEYRLLP